MTTIARAWEAFQAAVAEAMTLHASGGSVAEIHDLLQHARELLDIIADEITLTGADLPKWARNGLEQLRERLTAAEDALVTKH
jgi:hypothetical protein